MALIVINNLIKGAGSFLAGVAALPATVVIHEGGHYMAAKLFCKGAAPKIHLEGFAWMKSYVSGFCYPRSRALLGYSFPEVAIAMGGPLVETISVLAATKLIGGRQIAIAALPTLVHMIYNATSPLFCIGCGTDFEQARQAGGDLVYAISLLGTLAATGSIIHQIVKEYPSVNAKLKCHSA